MQILESVVNNRRPKMLIGFSCSGYGGSPLFRHGRTALPAYREHLLYRVTSTEQGKPVSLPARGRSTVRWIDGGAGIGIASKRTLPCNRADRGCVASMGQDYLARNLSLIHISEPTRLGMISYAV